MITILEMILKIIMIFHQLNQESLLLKYNYQVDHNN